MACALSRGWGATFDGCSIEVFCNGVPSMKQFYLEFFDGVEGMVEVNSMPLPFWEKVLALRMLPEGKNKVDAVFNLYLRWHLSAMTLAPQSYRDDAAQQAPPPNGNWCTTKINRQLTVCIGPKDKNSIISWAAEKCGIKRGFPEAFNFLLAACEAGSFQAARLVAKITGFKPKTRQECSLLLDAAAAGSKPSMIKWLIKALFPRFCLTEQIKILGIISDGTSASIYIDETKCLSDVSKLSDDEMRLVMLVTGSLIFEGHETGLKLAHLIGFRYGPQSAACEFWQACRKGNLTVAKWLASHCKEDLFKAFPIGDKPMDAFEAACSEDRLDIVQWMWFDLWLGLHYPMASRLKALKTACLEGAMKVARFLADKVDDDEGHFTNDGAFADIVYTLVSNGRTSGAQWIVERFRVPKALIRGHRFLATEKNSKAIRWLQEWLDSE